MRSLALAVFSVLTLAGCEAGTALLDGADDSSSVARLEAGGRAVRAPLPAGHCAIDTKHGADARLDEVLRAAQKAGGVATLLIFADCEELAAWREGKQGTLDRFGTLGAPSALLDKDVTESPPAFARRIEASFREQGLDSVERARDAMNRRLAEVSAELRVDEMRPLGVLATDERASYIGVVQKVRSEFGDTKVVAGVIAIGAVNKRALRLELYRSEAGAGATAIEALLGQARDAFAALAAAN